MAESAAKLYEKFGKTVHEGEIVFREGDFGDSMFIIQEGEVEIRKKAGSAFKVLTTLRAGDFFGEMAIIDKSPRSATACAIRKCQLLEVTNRSFEFMLENNLDFTKRLVKELCEKIRSSNHLIFELLTQNKQHRVASALVRWTRQNWRLTDEGNVVDLAPFLDWSVKTIGIEQESVLAILNALVKGGKLLARQVDGKRCLVIPSGALQDVPPARL